MLLGLLVALAPGDVSAALDFGERRAQTADSLRRAAEDGASSKELASAYAGTVGFETEERFAEDLETLRAARQGPFRYYGLSEDALTAEPMVVHDLARSDDGFLRPTGSDPYSVYRIEPRRYVRRVRVRLETRESSTGAMAFQAFWRDARREDFVETERTVRRTVFPRDGVIEVELDVREVVDELRLDFGGGDRDVRVTSLVVVGARE